MLTFGEPHYAGEFVTLSSSCAEKNAPNVGGGGSMSDSIALALQLKKILGSESFARWLISLALVLELALALELELELALALEIELALALDI